MTYETVADSNLAESRSLEASSRERKQLSFEEVTDCLKVVREDIGQINKLATEEMFLVEQLIVLLQNFVPSTKSSIEVSPSALPIEVGKVKQAEIKSSGHLKIVYANGRQRLLDLSEIENRDVLIAVIEDILPKFRELNHPALAEKLQEPIQVQLEEPPAPAIPEPQEPELAPPVSPEVPVCLEDVAPPNVPQEVEPPEKIPEVPAELTPLADQNAKILAVEAETLEFLGMLGNEVFEQAPVSKYFDDWMVNLRQIVLSFESNELIGPEDAFANEYNQIFSNIEAELTKRLAAEADIEVSARRLVENRYLLNKIDEGYAAQTKELVAKGKDAIETLTKNLRQLEKELTEAAQIKVSFRHPLQKLAKDQKISELTQKLTIAKKQLAMAVGSSSVDKTKTDNVDDDYAAQTQELAEKRKSALAILTQEVQSIEEELIQIDKTKTANPIKRTALAQKRFDATQKLIAAEKRLEVAEQNSNAELERLKAEYDKKKQAAIGNMQTLENDIATKAPDNSAEVRKAAAQALTEAVKARIQRKISASASPSL